MPDQKIKKLNLGSGADNKDGYINIDWNEFNHPDVQHDLNKFPYPFEDSTFDLIEASHVLEHLDKPFMVMKELHRILKPNGKLIIKVPHFTRGFTHVEHTHGFDVTFPNYFNKKLGQAGYSGYFGVDYELEKLELHWMAFFHLLSILKYPKPIIVILKLFNSIFSWLANCGPGFCSRFWSFWVGGFEEIEFHFKCLKDNQSI